MSEGEESSLRRLEALIIVLQSRLEVLEATVAVIHKDDTRIGDKTVLQYLKEETENRTQWYLASISDRNPALATELAKILDDAKREQ